MPLKPEKTRTLQMVMDEPPLAQLNQCTFALEEPHPLLIPALFVLEVLLPMLGKLLEQSSVETESKTHQKGETMGTLRMEMADPQGESLKLLMSVQEDPPLPKTPVLLAQLDLCQTP